MEKNSLITIIIPMYNAACFIGRTIDCLSGQTMRDFDVLFIDNNSDDNVRDIIIDRLDKSGDDAFSYKLLVQNKSGVSNARNMGIDFAKGKYILFIDADDCFESDYLKKMSDVLENNPEFDLAFCGYDTYEEGAGRPVYESPEISAVTYYEDEMLSRLFKVEHYQGFIWNKLFKNEIIKKYNLKFDSDIYYNEDRLFIVRYLLHAKGALMIPDRLYHYEIHSGSAQANVLSDDLNQFEKNVTEIAAFSRMRKALKKNSALRDCETDMVFSIFRLFRPLLTSEKSNAKRYSKSALRKYARFAFRIHFEPKDLRDTVVFRKFIQYGWTGSVYTSDLSWFERDD